MEEKRSYKAAIAPWSPERIADTNAVSEGPTLASTLGKRGSSFLEYDYGEPLDCATKDPNVTTRNRIVLHILGGTSTGETHSWMGLWRPQ